MKMSQIGHIKQTYGVCRTCLSRSPSSPPPSFTQYPSPPRSLVRDGQTSPNRPRLVVSRSTCPPLFPPRPQANSFVMGTAVINTHTRSPDGWDQIPRWAGGWACTLHQPAWSFGFDSQNEPVSAADIDRVEGTRARGAPLERDDVVYWYLIQYALHLSAYASLGRVCR